MHVGETSRRMGDLAFSEALMTHGYRRPRANLLILGEEEAKSISVTDGRLRRRTCLSRTHWPSVAGLAGRPAMPHLR